MLISYPRDIQRVLSNLVLQCLMWRPRQEWMTGAFSIATSHFLRTLLYMKFKLLSWSNKSNIRELDCFLSIYFSAV